MLLPEAVLVLDLKVTGGLGSTNGNRSSTEIFVTFEVYFGGCDLADRYDSDVKDSALSFSDNFLSFLVVLWVGANIGV